MNFYNESSHKTMMSAIGTGIHLLRQDDRNRVKLHIADLAAPILLCALDESRDAIYGTTTDGEQITLSIWDVRAIGLIPFDQVRPEEYNDVAKKKAAQFSRLPSVQSRFESTYQLLIKSDVFESELESKRQDSDESLFLTFVRLQIEGIMIRAYQPFTSKKDWLYRLSGHIGIDAYEHDQRSEAENNSSAPA